MTFPLIRSFALAALVVFTGCGGGGGGGTPNPAPAPSTAPTISGLSVSHGAPGALVAITGTNLTGTSAVSFNGRAAFSFTVVGATEVDAVVPSGATTGTIQVTTSGGSATSTSFTVDAALTPTIASFTPTSLSAGSVATITGTHLVGASQVQFNGVNATAFTVTSDTQVSATAPAGLSAGVITVTTPGGTATSTAYTIGSSAPTQAQVLLNADFESTAPIAWKGDVGIIQPAPGTSSPGAVPHGGTLFAWFDGYSAAGTDQVTQDMFIPATATSATMTFYLKIVTNQTGSSAVDTFTISALDTTDNLLANGLLFTKSNADVNNAYASFSVNLLPFKGQVVRLLFKGTQAGAIATSFLVDDVAATIAVPTAADLAPIITSFTPTSGVAGEATVAITGKNFFGLTNLTLGGVTATYTQTDGTALSAPIPALAAAGSAPIRLTNALGTGSSATNFTVAYGTPTSTGMNPTQGPVGTPVTITGTHLGYPGTTVTINGTAVSSLVTAANQITFTVPTGATTGAVLVTTPGGSLPMGTFTVNTAGTTLDLHIEKVQFTQSTQTLDNTVPIVAGRAGLVRVFVLANQANTVIPTVQVTLLNGSATVVGYPKPATRVGASVPTVVNESDLANSWNLAIPATDLTTPSGAGYSVQVVVNGGGAIPEADATNNTFDTHALTSTTVPTFKTTIFPVVLIDGNGNITEANKATWAARLAKMFPIANVDVAVGATFTGSVSTLDADGTGWDTLLNDLTAKHLADASTASDRYYFGALNVAYSSGVAGLGWVPGTSSYSFKYRTAIGWDKTGYQDGGNFPEVFAHETGHNMGRNHSPCGGAASPDPNYPYAGALIGKWGYDSVLNALHSPSEKDIMAYCSPNWVSDYVYKKILDFRNGTGGFRVVGAEDAPLPKGQDQARECLIVRGIIHDDGKVEMLPSFRTQALPTALSSKGEFTLECQNAQGNAIFSTALELMELGCSPKGHPRHFVMALPLDAQVLDALAGLQVLKGGLVQASQQSAPAMATARIITAAPEALRISEDKLQLTWDASVHPAALVRDADTGEVIAILGGGRQSISTKAKRFDLVLSDGVTGPTHHLDTTK